MTKLNQPNRKHPNQMQVELLESINTKLDELLAEMKRDKTVTAPDTPTVKAKKANFLNRIFQT